MLTRLPPLTLYVHLPWCARKCPYCDFNSHAVREHLPESAYLDALLVDLESEAERVGDRQLSSIFIGGGTPSLFSGRAIRRLLERIFQLFATDQSLEVTLEANPGSSEHARFSEYSDAGVNRLSIGVQSFDDNFLRALGRVHCADEAHAALDMALRSGFSRINIDLMHGLPDQTVTLALADLKRALAFAPGHISWYQLTIEPNTRFARAPPKLPAESVLNAIQNEGQMLLEHHGYHRYEVSAFARKDHQCLHNLNYWLFGDFIGIGAGAHGKVSDLESGIRRYWKTRVPAHYMAPDRPFTAGERWLNAAELPLEFLMNALRLNAGVDSTLFSQRTGLEVSAIGEVLDRLRRRGLLQEGPARLATTPLGYRFLNDVLAEFA